MRIIISVAVLVALAASAAADCWGKGNVIATRSQGRTDADFGSFFAWGSCNNKCFNHDGNQCPAGSAGGVTSGATCVRASGWGADFPSSCTNGKQGPGPIQTGQSGRNPDTRTPCCTCGCVKDTCDQNDNPLIVTHFEDSAGNCRAQPTCNIGELLGGSASDTRQGSCETCPQGQFKDANGHQWLECNEKTDCDENANEDVLTHFTTNPSSVTEDSACVAQPTCDVGQKLGGGASPISQGSCVACDAGTFKDAGNHQWLSCNDKDTTRCDANGVDDEILTHFCSNINDLTADCNCDAQPTCSLGEKLGGSAGVFQEGTCVECEEGTYKDAAAHQWLTCLEKSAANCDENANAAATTHFCSNLSDKTADCTCEAHPTCNVGEKLGCTGSGCTNEEAETRLFSEQGVCIPCDSGTFKDANNHQWLECVDKDTTRCDANGADDEILTHFCDNLNDLTADCTCTAQPTCGIGELLGGSASVTSEGTCEECPTGTYKDAAAHQWLTCLEKSAANCDENANAAATTHFCSNLSDKTADCTCEAHPTCNVGEKLGCTGSGCTNEEAETRLFSEQGVCIPCDSGTFKDANNHQWLECVDKDIESCDENANEDVITHFCDNLNDLTADCTCTAHPTCGVGELLGGSVSLTTTGTCEQCPAGTYKDAAAHQWLTCLEKDTSICDDGPDDQILTQFCNNFNDKTAQCECAQQTQCAAGERLKDTAADGTDLTEEQLLTTELDCEACPSGQFKDANDHQWLECFPKDTSSCDANGPEDGIIEQWCSNFEDPTADCACQAQPECDAGELLGDGASVTKLGKCEACPTGTFKAADGHRWLECVEKDIEGCDENANEDVITHFCDNLNDLTADCTCTAHPTCGVGELLGGQVSLTTAGACEQCPLRTYKDAAAHQWLTCIDQVECNVHDDTRVQLQYLDGAKYSEVGQPALGTCRDQPDCGQGELLGGGADEETLGSCEQCPSGTYKDANAHRWLECIKQITCGKGERYADPDGDAAVGDKTEAVCVECPLGQYMDETDHRNPVCKSQVVCPQGTKYPEVPPTTAPAKCDDCPIGFFQDENFHQKTECIPHTNTCGEGKRNTAKTSTAPQQCIDCEEGKYIDTKFHTTETCWPHAVACGPGERIEGTLDIVGELVKADLPKGRSRECYSCDPGSYRSEKFHDKVECWIHTQTCGRGQWISEQNTTSEQECYACAEGKFQNGTEGELGLHTNSWCYDHEEIFCGKGQWISELNTSHERGCYDCPNGKFQDSERHQSGCLPQIETCEAGQWISELNTTAARSCFPCPKGAFRPDGAHAFTKCIKQDTVCSAGGTVLSEATPTAKQECVVCPEGTFYPTLTGLEVDNEVEKSRTKCTPFSVVDCQRDHFFVAGTKTKDQRCDPCPEGEEMPLRRHTQEACVAKTTTPLGQVTIGLGGLGGLGGEADPDTPEIDETADDIANAKQLLKAAGEAGGDELKEAIDDLDDLTKELAFCIEQDRDDCATLTSNKQQAQVRLSEVSKQVAEALKQASNNVAQLTFKELDMNEVPANSLGRTKLTSAIHGALDKVIGTGSSGQIIGKPIYTAGSVIATLTFTNSGIPTEINIAPTHDRIIVVALGLFRDDEAQPAVFSPVVPPKNDGGGLSGGAIAGIIIALLIVLALIAFLVFKKNEQPAAPSDYHHHTVQKLATTYDEVKVESGVSNPNYDANINAGAQPQYEAVGLESVTDDIGGVSNPNYGQPNPNAPLPSGPGSFGASNPTYGQHMRVESKTGTIDRSIKLVAGDEYTGAALVHDQYLDVAPDASGANAMYAVPMEV